MSDNNFEIRAKLTADDLASGQFDKLIQKTKQLERQIKQSFAKNKISTEIISPDLMKNIQGTGRAISGLTDKYKTMAREQRDLGNMSADGWRKITREVKAATRAYEQAAGASKKQREAARRDLVEKVKYAQAYRYVFNNENRRLLQAQEAHNSAMTSIESLKRRRDIAAERAHNREIMRERRSLHRNLREMSYARYGMNRAALFGAAAAGAVGFGATSSVKQAISVDRAETFARMNMNQSKVNARELRNNWALPKSVEMGADPGELFQSAVEAAKAGVPERLAAVTSELAFMTAKRFGIGTQEMMEGLGRSIAVEIGSGRMKGNDQQMIASLRRKFNIASSLASESATTPAEVLSFLRYGMGAGASLGMSDVSTFAFGNAAIEAGGQARQSARFLAHLGEEIGQFKMKEKTIRKKGIHRSPEDKMFLSLPGQLGYGSYQDIQDSFRTKPDTALFDLIKSFKKIKDPLDRSAALHSFWGSEFGPIMRNMIDSPGLMDDSLSIAKRAAGEDSKTDSIFKAWTEYQKGLENILERVSTVWKVLKAEVGDTFKPFLIQLSDWVTDWYKAVGSSGIKVRLDAVLRGLIEGFLGKPGDLRDLLNSVFGKPGEGSSGGADKFFKFAKGFAEGIRSIASAFGSMFTSLAGFFGGSDAESMGKLAGQILTLVAALTALAPVLSVFSSLLTIVGGLVAVLGGPVVIGAFAAGAAEAFTPNSAKKSAGESTSDYRKRRQEHKKSLYQLQSGEGFDPSMVHPMSLRSSMDDLNDQLKQFGGKVELASFKSGGLGDFSGGGVHRAFYGGGGNTSSSGGGSMGIPSLLSNTPGAALPDFGAGSGGIIKRGGISGGLNKSAFERTFAGTPLAGKYDQIVTAAKAHGLDPSLLAGVIAHESGKGRFLSGNNPGGIMDPSTGWARKMQFSGLDAGIAKTASVLAKNYNAVGGDMSALANRYAPRGAANDPGGLNGNWLGGVTKFRGDMSGSSGGLAGSGDAVGIAEKFKGLNEYSDTQKLAAFLGADPRGKSNAWCARFVNSTLAAAGGKGTGSAAAKSFFNWGEAVKDGVKRNDVMVAPHHVGLATGKVSADGKMIQMISGNHGDAVGYSWEPRGKYQLRRGSLTGGVPLPQDAIKNVPSITSRNGDASLGGGSAGPVAIHINGGAHDPEALALLVQRRVDESMNWRIHDSESEYT